MAEDKTATNVTLDDLQNAYTYIRSCPSTLYKRTPMISHWKDQGDCSTVSESCDLNLKLENMQVTGSYKVRGVLYQLHHFTNTRPKSASDCGLFTLSAGNYGKAFAYLTRNYPRRLVLMPDTAPPDRQRVIESYGADVERVKASSSVFDRIAGLKSIHGMTEMPSIECIQLVTGHASVGLEMLEDVKDPGVVLVPCGGGALLAGVSLAIKLSGFERCRVYGIEPEQANTMFQSLRQGEALTIPTARSVASGLSPPFVGTIPFEICRQFVEDILLVPEDAIRRAVVQLYKQGLVVEPAGAVGYAALSLGLVPDIEGRRVVVVVSGGNVTIEEMADMKSKSDIDLSK